MCSVVRALRIAVLCCLCSGQAWHGKLFNNSLRADEFKLMRLLPADTLAYMRCGDFAALDESLQQSPAFQLWNAPQMQAFRSELEKSNSDIVGVMRHTYGIDLELIQQAVAGEFVVAGFETHAGTLSLTFFVQTSDAESSLQLLRQTAQRLIADGAVRENRDSAFAAEVYRLADAPEEQVVLATLDKYFMLSGDAQIAERLMERWRQPPVDGLGSSEVFSITMQQLPEPTASDVQWFINPIRLAVAADKGARKEPSATAADSAEQNADPRPPFAMRHGFPGLQAIAGKVWMGEDGWNYRLHVALHAPPPRTAAMRIFDFPPQEIAAPDFVTQEVNVLTRLSWNLSAMIENLEDLYDDVTDSPGAFKETLEDYKQELRVDLKQDVFAKLGPEIISFSLYDPKLGVESSIISIAIKDAAKNERSLAAALHSLLVEDTETIRRQLPGFRYDLWQMGLTVGDGTTPFSSAGVMVADGRLWIATHAAMIERALRRGARAVLADADDYHKFAKAFASRTTNRDFGTMFSRVDRDFEYTYNVLKNGGTEGLQAAENMYSALLTRVFEQLDRDVTLDFSTLPEFQDIRGYLGIAGITARVTDTGWEIEAGGISR